MRQLFPLFIFLSLFFGQIYAEEIVINNRVFTKVAGKPITLLDVVKVMDGYLASYQKEILKDTRAREQFYSTNWTHFLVQLIDKELTLADSKEKCEKFPALKISDAVVRKEIIERYGPDVIATLRSIPLTYEEAKAQVFADLTERQMQGAFVYTRADVRVTAADVESTYLAYLDKNPPKTEWEYQVLTVRSPKPSLSEALSNKAYLVASTSEDPLSPANLMAQTQEKEAIITASNELILDDKNISEKHRAILADLKVGSYSKPIFQEDAKGESSYKIFYLKNKTEILPEPFETQFPKLRGEKFNKEFTKELDSYHQKLRARFGIDTEQIQKNIPANYVPFGLI